MKAKCFFYRCHLWLVLSGLSQLCCGGNQMIVMAQQDAVASDGGESQNPTSTSMEQNALILSVGNDGFTQQECLQALLSVMSHAGDSMALSDAQKTETSFAILNAAVRHYPEQPTGPIAKIMISNIRQESDFQTDNVSGEREGSGDALGLLQVSPYGNSQELELFRKHADTSGLADYRTREPVVAASLQPNDLFDPWINVHVATWIQSNLARSGSADPSDWGTKQGPRPPNYLTALGSWVAGPAASDASGYGNSGDDISPPYFKAILEELNALQGTSVGTEFLSEKILKTQLVHFLP